MYFVWLSVAGGCVRVCGFFGVSFEIQMCQMLAILVLGRL